MQLTQEEYAAVAVYENQIITAVRSRYLRNVGRSGLAALVPIYERVKGCKVSVNHNCAACILGFLQRMGEIYLADKAEREQSLQPADVTDVLPGLKKSGRHRRHPVKSKE